jgi:hypothetical protein
MTLGAVSREASSLPELVIEFGKPCPDMLGPAGHGVRQSLTEQKALISLDSLGVYALD